MPRVLGARTADVRENTQATRRSHLNGQAPCLDRVRDCQPCECERSSRACCLRSDLAAPPRLLAGDPATEAHRAAGVATPLMSSHSASTTWNTSAGSPWYYPVSGPV